MYGFVMRFVRVGRVVVIGFDRALEDSVFLVSAVTWIVSIVLEVGEESCLRTPGCLDLVLEWSVLYAR